VKSRSFTQSGPRTQVDTDSFGNSTTLITFPDAYYDSFSVLAGENTIGNRKSPNANIFSHSRSSVYRGSRISNRINSRVAQVVTGVLGGGNQPAFNLPRDNTNLYNQALSDLNGRLRSEIDLSVDILQGRQTANMVKTAVNTVNYVRSFRKALLRDWFFEGTRKRTSMNSHVKDWFREGIRDKPWKPRQVGSKWLEFQYGWKPLAQTIYDSVIELNREFPSRLVLEQKSLSITSGSQKQQSQLDPSIQETITWNMSERILLKCRFNPPASSAQLLSNFTSLNPASIAWEMTPYSFVVDWFYDVGGYLRNMETALLYSNNFVDGFYTYTRRYSHKAITAGQYTLGSDVITINASFDRIDSYKNRTPLGSYPSPKKPRFRFDLGSGQLLNAAALLSQFLRK